MEDSWKRVPRVRPAGGIGGFGGADGSWYPATVASIAARSRCKSSKRFGVCLGANYS